MMNFETVPIVMSSRVVARVTRARLRFDANARENARRVSSTSRTVARAMELVDIGVNLTDEMFSGVYRGKRAHDDDRALVLRRAREVGVTDAIVTAGTLEEAREVVEMVRERERSGEDATGTPRLRATCGVHPTRCGAFDADVDGADGHLEKLRAVAMDGTTDGTIVAIGELGLDYDRLEFCDAETQKRMFEKQFALSEATGLPLFLHMRAAREDFLEIIARNRHRFTEGVVHSFTGSAEDARAVLAVDGLHIGVNGCSLKTQQNLDVVRDIPLERMCLETDAPWCGIKRTHAGFEHVSSPKSWPAAVKKEKWTPGTFVKDRCEPAHALHVAQIVAAVKKIHLHTVAEITSANARRIFRL